MGLAAWEPLRLCEEILERLTNSDFDRDDSNWKILWIAGLATLRAVGQVLDKVDKIDNREIAPIIVEKWQQLKARKSDYPIFWDFIDKERDLILKEFRLGVEAVPIMVANDGGGQFDLVDDLADMPWELLANDGSFEATQQFGEAVEFWRAYLTDIETVKSATS